MNTLPRPRPFVFIVLDGWGISFTQEGNAIMTASTPTMDMFAQYFPTAALSAASIEVGLPWGEVGNSETGHRNIGAGQVQYQLLPMIENAIEKGSFFENQVFLSAIDHVKDHDSSLHLMGLLSPGGVHSHHEHLYALLRLATRAKLKDRVYIHLFTDGRDVPQKSIERYLNELKAVMDKEKIGRIASVTGRFYAMDRNQNWDRTQATYDMLVGTRRMAGAPTPENAIAQAYAQNVFDEMIPPTSMTQGGSPLVTIKDGDAVIFFNFRPDRARQLSYAFADPHFSAFPTQKFSQLFFATMAEYDPLLPAPYAFKEPVAEYPLARVISDGGLTQFHVAETEKYAHITYYLNVGHEQPFPGETYELIRSSTVKNFADAPQMAAEEITNRVLAALDEQKYDIYFINYANPDMVAHTGNFEAAVEACAFVDTCLARIYEAVMKYKGAMIITADHGNAEEMLQSGTTTATTDHSTNPVPFHYIHPQLARVTPRSQAEVRQVLSAPIGVLADVAPTVLEMLHLPQPPSMTGVSLLSSISM